MDDNDKNKQSMEVQDKKTAQLQSITIISSSSLSLTPSIIINPSFSSRRRLLGLDISESLTLALPDDLTGSGVPSFCFLAGGWPLAEGSKSRTTISSSSASGADLFSDAGGDIGEAGVGGFSFFEGLGRGLGRIKEGPEGGCINLEEPS